MRPSIALLLILLSSLLPVGSSADSPFSASTFLGGGGDDGYYVASVAFDAEGNIYVAGDTASDDFPTTEGALDTTFNGGKDIFVSKFDPGLTRLLASTYLGGGGEEFGCGLIIDGDGNVIVAGQTYSTDFPTTEGAFDGSHNGDRDVFVSKLSGDLTTLLGSTYLGGSGGDTAFRSFMALDEEGNIYLTCYTESVNYPVTEGAYDTTYNNVGDIAVTLLDSSLTRVIASTYVGAERNDWPYAIGCSPSGVYVTGHTDSTGFPASDNAYDTGYNGGTDVFVCALDRDLKTLIGATFLGGSGFDNTCTLLIEPSGDVVVAGHTASRDFPTTINAYSEDYGGGERDIFVSRLSPDLSNLKRSTLLGGSDSEIQPLLAPLPDGAIALTGETRSPDFPFTDGLFKGANRITS
ncbi:MAG: SBBP repeat-containing protein, partial [Candidatus Bathyarchaeota archaeon]|nr:SBBP repeat-containing protein [Candidatus Bathyarchaeota archaeon]